MIFNIACANAADHTAKLHVLIIVNIFVPGTYIVTLLPELYFLKQSHVLPSSFLWNLIVATVVAHYGCYSAKVFANALKHFDFHQHTVPVQVTAHQTGVQFVPDKEHPVWIPAIWAVTCKFSIGDITNSWKQCRCSRLMGKTMCLNSTNQGLFKLSSVLMIK